jgi:uncharacterized protein (TIGR03437 family)
MSSDWMIYKYMLVAALCPLVFAAPEDRLNGPIDSRRAVVLAGGRNPRTQLFQDDGALAPASRIRGLGLRFKPRADRQAELEQLLQDQQNPLSPQYHAWLTPEEFGDRFGLSHNDLARVNEWVQAQGFQIEYTARSRTYVTFSGSAEQVRNTFGTELHRFRRGIGAGYAKTSAIHVPAELEPLIYTVTGLDELPNEPRGRAEPRINARYPSHLLGPGDLATIYNVNPLLQKGFDGSGQSIAVAGASAIQLADIQAYRTLVGLPKNDPRIMLVPGFDEPGVTDEIAEATGDVEIAGASAPNATIIFVYSRSAFAAATYAVDQALAPVISYSYGGCEQNAVTDPGTMTSGRAVAQQANAQGITWISCAGDSGPADCERQKVEHIGSSGMWVELPASYPEVTAVGGTLFADGTGKFWTDATGWAPSALSYIPEVAWNETSPEEGLAASGGGASMFYPKPSWQTGPGIPNVNARLLPDISFAASWNHDPYLIVLNGQPLSWGGTSAGTPFFAGVATILNQYLVASGVQTRPGLGNMNPRLYELARTAPAAFHDITIGDNIVPCKSGTPDCVTGQYGYTAGAGWDAATGLGSLDVSQFVLRWAAANDRVSPTTTAVIADPSTISSSTSTTLTATVKADGGLSLPTGTVQFTVGQTQLGSADLSPAAGGAVARLVIKSSQLAKGANIITASYGGASNLSPSTANTTVKVATAGSAVTATADPQVIYPDKPDADGYTWHYTIVLTESAGVSTKVTSFTIDGVDYTSQFAVWFTSANIPANGSVTGYMRSKEIPVPFSPTFVFRGVDADGQTWSRSLTVTFAGPNTGRISLSSLPAVVTRTAGDSGCSAEFPLRQNLLVQELNGKGVRLTKFMAGGSDMSSQIQSRFGSLRLAPFGALAASFCWKIDPLPATVTFELDGVDSGGVAVTTNLQVTFQAPGQNPGRLTISKESVSLTVAPAGSANARLDVTVPDNEPWSVTVFPANQNSRWLRISPQSGKGPGQVTLTASAENVPAGVYVAHVQFQSANTVPQYIDVPIVFVVGVSDRSTITGAQNAASFRPVFAPGMLMSLYGSNLANTTRSATSVPLPYTLDGVTATVDGIPAPLWFISPGQINIQIPYETRTGSVLVAVANNGQVSSYIIQVASSAPGIFNYSGAIVPVSTAKRAAAVSIYITGDGETTPMVETGAPPPAATPVSQLPKPILPVTVTVAGIPAQVRFIGNPFLVGVTQINFEVPANAPLGAQPVVVTVGTVSSASQTLVVLE